MDGCHGRLAEFRRRIGGIGPQHDRLDWLIAGELLSRSDRFPRCAMQLAALLFGNHEDHPITRASSLSFWTSALAASAGEPEIICVCFVLRGTSRPATLVRAAGSDAGATLRISFFFAAMMPFNVAYRS